MTARPLPIFGFSLIIVLVLCSSAAAQGPFGVGTPEPTIMPGGGGGLFGTIFAQVAEWQSEFYQSLTGALADLREDGSAFWLLGGVSFLYGVFHAAGPGHGKAVISAYILASGETLRRGVVIAFIASFVQALVAVVLVSVAAGVLRVTAISMTAATDILEIASYALIVLIGVWMVYSKTFRVDHQHAPQRSERDNRWRAEWLPAHATEASLAFAAHDHAGHQHLIGHHGHGHTVDPAILRRPLTFVSAWTAIAAVGIRPCTGSVIVLVFALSQGLFAAGIASTLLMAFGTAITVAALASFAVLAREYCRATQQRGVNSHPARYTWGGNPCGGDAGVAWRRSPRWRAHALSSSLGSLTRAPSLQT